MTQKLTKNQELAMLDLEIAALKLELLTQTEIAKNNKDAYDEIYEKNIGYTVEIGELNQHITKLNGEIKRLITKAKMTGMGLNWQHCNHSVFFPTWSYEQYYQSIRRFWRFGQKRDVTIDMVISDGQTRVLEALQQKTQKAIELHKHRCVG